MKALRRLALLASVATSSVMLAAPMVEAQSTTAGMRVRVVNENGEAVASVPLIIKHIPTGRTRTVQTSATGTVLLPNLAVGGPYLVKVADGASFLSQEVNNVFLELGSTETVVVPAIAVSAVTAAQGEQSQAPVEEITVTGTALVTALRNGPGSDFSTTDIQSIPSIGRDFAETLALDPKVTVDSGVARGPAISIAGQNFRFNTLTVDGVPQNDSFGLSFNASATQRTPISIDAISAINVNAAPYNVEFGNFVGGNINIVTKSGTNEFHGTAFGFYTDNGLTGNTNDGQDLGATIGDFDETIFGGTFSGPIVKDKLFFFAAYERFETSRPANSTSLAELGVDPAEVAEIQDIFRTVYNFEPGDFAVQDDDEDEKILLKLDWNINERHRAVAAYQRAAGDFLRDDFADTVSLNTSRYNTNERLNSYSFQVFSDWTDNFSTEFKIGYKDVKNRQRSIDTSTPFITVGTSAGVNVVAGGDPFRGLNELDNSSTLIKLKADYFTGNHKLTFGYEYDHFYALNQFGPFFRGQVDYLNIDDFRNNQPFLFLLGGSTTGDVNDIRAEFGLTTHTFYAQDEWAITDTFTLTLGLRYDFLVNDDEILENEFFEARTGFSNTENLDGKDLISPRLGFTWDATERLSVRGGVGIFGGGAPNIFLSGAYQGNGITRIFANGVVDLTRLGIPVPPSEDFVNARAALPAGDALQQFFLDDLADLPVENNPVDAIDPDFNIFNSLKASVGFDYDADLSSIGLGEDWQFTFDYIYTNVIDGFDIRDDRRQVVGTAPDGRPVYDIPGGTDFIVTNTSGGRSHVVAFAAEKRWETEDWGSFNLNVGYTFTDTTDARSYARFINGEAFGFDPQRDLNNPDVTTSAFETRHRYTARLTWEKALFQENAFTRVTLFYNGRSGTPFNFVFNGGGFDGSGLAFGGDGTFESAGALSPGSSLFYVPTGRNDPLVTGDGEFLRNLDSFIRNNDCLNEQRGQIYERNSCRNSFVHSLDLNITQEIEIVEDQFVELILNIQNLGNFINSDWGTVDRFRLEPPESVDLASVSINDQNQFVYGPTLGNSTFVAPQPLTVALPSVYRVQFGIRYRF